MPTRLWVLMGALCLAIGAGSALALYVGVQELRLHRAGPRRQMLAGQLAGARGWVQVLACARHDLEVAVGSDGEVVTGERALQDRVYVPLTAPEDCDDETPPREVLALLESQDAAAQGLGKLYAQGYRAPPTKVIVEGVIGFGVGDGRRERRARQALESKLPSLGGRPLLVKDRRPTSPAAAYATAAVGLHGLLLLGALAFLGVRRRLRGGLPEGFSGAEP